MEVPDEGKGRNNPEGVDSKYWRMVTDSCST